MPQFCSEKFGILTTTNYKGTFSMDAADSMENCKNAWLPSKKNASFWSFEGAWNGNSDWQFSFEGASSMSLDDA
ncbi:hypothetical protein SAY87_014717 [Trapa incisa]|uniref:Uncharacterized protein n=1 Tax=Trapa incisa TaxID=236973 RepID=A0AAN7JDJ1_9MYRT|nr:hypothetical protein SAY87_014717 [Trapa incisa]